MVQIIDGIHSGKQAKILKLDDHQEDLLSSLKNQTEDTEADPNSYVCIELTYSGAILNIKRKRLLLQSLHDKISGSNLDTQQNKQLNKRD